MTLNSRAQDLTIGGRTRGRAQVQLFATLTTESDLFQIKGATSCLDGMQIRGAKEAQVYDFKRQ